MVHEEAEQKPIYEVYAQDGTLTLTDMLCCGARIAPGKVVGKEVRLHEKAVAISLDGKAKILKCGQVVTINSTKRSPSGATIT